LEKVEPKAKAPRKARVAKVNPEVVQQIDKSWSVFV